jgi:feruloyl esterase
MTRMGFRAPVALALLVSVALVGIAQAGKPSTCAALANLRLPNTTITSASIVPAGPLSQVTIGDPYAAEGTTSPLPTCSSPNASPQLPSFCRVTAGIATPGAPEPINIEVWLPLQGWNGKFEHMGNHGFAGEIEYADMGPELLKGYAVAATDTGHAGGSATAWMQNEVQILNYGFRGIHEATVASKAIITAAFGQEPRFSYFNGCSTGGKEGLMEAQRYPDDYDGINVGGSANFAQIHNREEYVWNGQVTFGNAATPLGVTQTALVNAGAIKACDALDGVVDGVIENPLTCNFQPQSLICAQGQNPSTCLSQAQADAVSKVYAGPRDPVTGKQIYPGLGRGTELGWGSSTTGPGVSTADTFFKFMVFNDPNWNFETFNFHTDVANTDARFAVTLDAVNPDLRAYRKRGGRILQSHLWNSVVHPAFRTIEYYDQVVSFMNGNDDGQQGNGKGGDHGAVLESSEFRSTQQFYRLFMGPGGIGSSAPVSFDSLPYLERWVEEGIAPDSILAEHLNAGTVDRTRPLCVYPAFAVYKGHGSTDEAANFECHEPAEVPNYWQQENMIQEPLAPAPK